MALVTPSQPRSVVTDEPGALRIEIPVKRNAFYTIFLTFWLGGWACGEYFAAREIIRSKALFTNLFLIFWLGMWTVFGLMAIWSWLWILAGREIIRIESGILAIRKEIGGLGRTKEYSVSEMRDLRVGPPVYQGRRNMIPDGTIAFDYGAKTYRFAQAIDEAEAKQLIDTIRQRYPIPGAGAAATSKPSW